MPPGRRVTPQGATPSQAGILEASAKDNGWRRRAPPRPQQQGAGRRVRRRVRRRRIADAARRGSNGGDRIRTDDPLLAKQVLYQLSYAPRWSPFSMAAIVPHDAAHTTAGGAGRRPGPSNPGPSKRPDARLASGGLLSALRSSAESNGPGRT